jgi:Protein of unknown function (DUF2917)
MVIHDPYRVPLGVECAWPAALRVDAAKRSELPMPIQLKRGVLLRVCECEGKQVIAHSGSVWITEHGSLRDVVLHAGESFKLAGRGVALVEALGDASISLDPTCATEVLPL